MTTTRAISGANARYAGAAFEEDLDAAHEAYRRCGVAVIQRLPVPTSPMPRSWLSQAGLHKIGGGARILAKRQGYDYHGLLGLKSGPEEEPDRHAGIAVAMEAKATTGGKPSLPIIAQDRAGGGGLQEHQLRALAEVAEAGGVAVVVWRDGDPRDPGCFRGVLLPDALRSAWGTFEAGGRKSVPREAFTPYSLFDGFEDWLFEARQAMDLQTTGATT